MQDRVPSIKRKEKDFSDILEELNEPEAGQDIDAILKDMPKRRCYD